MRKDFEDQIHVLEKGQTPHPLDISVEVSGNQGMQYLTDSEPITSSLSHPQTIEGAENKRVCGTMAMILSNKSAYKAFLNSNGEKAQMALNIVQKVNQIFFAVIQGLTLYLAAFR